MSHRQPGDDRGGDRGGITPPLPPRSPYQGGVMIGWRPTHTGQRTEVLRVPDDGSGGPDTANELSLAIVAGGIAGFYDPTAGVSLTRFHYRVRHVFPGYAPGTPSKYIRGHGVRFDPNQIAIPFAGTANVLGGTAETPKSIWVQAGGTLLTPFFTPAQHAIFAMLSLTTTQTTTSAAGYYELQSTAAATGQTIIGLHGVGDGRHTTGTSAGIHGVSGLARVAGAGGTTTWLRGVVSNIEVTAGTVTNAARFYAAQGATGGTITNHYTLYAEAPTIGTNRYGIYLADVAGGTLNRAIYTNAGMVIFNAGAAANSNVLVGTTTDDGSGVQVLTGADFTLWGPTAEGLQVKTASTTASGAVLGGMFQTRTTVATTGSMQGVEGVGRSSHTSGTVTLLIGVPGNVRVDGVGGTTTHARGVTGGGSLIAGTTTNFSCFYAGAPETGGTITNTYGLYVESMTAGATSNYAIYTNAGRVVFNAGGAASSEVWIGHTTAATGNPRLDVVGDSVDVRQIVMANVTTNATRKFAGLLSRHYTNAEENVGLIIGDSDGTDNIVNIGGSSANVNAATILKFWTAADRTTVAGTLAADLTGVEPSVIMRVGGTIRQFSSNVAHGITDIVPTNVYGDLVAADTTTGGILLRGFRETGSAIATVIDAIPTDGDTTKTTAGVGGIVLQSSKKSGTGRGAHGADENLVTIRVNGTTRFIFDNEGSAHADVEWTTFAEHKDVALLDTLEHILVPTEFGRAVDESAAILERLGIIHDLRTENGKRRAMLNQTRLLMLLTGAIRQLAQRLPPATHHEGK